MLIDTPVATRTTHPLFCKYYEPNPTPVEPSLQEPVGASEAEQGSFGDTALDAHSLPSASTEVIASQVAAKSFFQIF